MAKTKTGLVTSINMEKSIVVRVDRMVSHRLYGKRYRVSKNFLVHDETNQAQVGDSAVIEETRPISKRKSWRLVSRQPGDTTTKVADLAPEGVTTEETAEEGVS
jgi:small subunit ribosomal protein S17